MKKIPSDMIAGTIHKTNRFGDVEVRKYHSSLSVSVAFVLTGYETKTAAHNIRRGQLKDPLMPIAYGVGFIGAGSHMSAINNDKNRAYTAWHDMLRRCYSPLFLNKYPSYIDCTVCRDWHNFQNFAKWFKGNYIDGYQLDKDIKIKGNKEYSPESCLFVTQSENSIASSAQTHAFTSPTGESVTIHDLSKFCRENKLERSSMGKLKSGTLNKHKGWSR